MPVGRPSTGPSEAPPVRERRGTAQNPPRHSAVPTRRPWLTVLSAAPRHQKIQPAPASATPVANAPIESRTAQNREVLGGLQLYRRPSSGPAMRDLSTAR